MNSILKNKQPIALVTQWVLLWLFLGAIHSYLLKPLWGLDGTNYLTTLYYILSAALVLCLYRVKSLLPHHEDGLRQLVYMGLFTAVVIFLGHIANELRPISIEQANYIKSELFSFPLFKLNTWAVKWSDVAYQQVMLLVILYRLSSLEISKKEMVWLTSIGFALLHFPLLMLFGWKGFYFIIPSIFAGFIFTYFILYMKRGLFYSYAVHISFYLILGMWIREAWTV
ncbi:hypothetical protein [Pseudobdellovibrio exovorus]|uniref:CPBP family intramembrane metalloprotease n=1 Tax=Pseudobdellovibrio exovorus JSS TaxID=1184267 RepID=M4VC75_9BACT|nr:hypothetical protein [Pseudobdellovibrio exovorus]AGH96080.1 hypothetical protein A11Q_1864 [Pseudobdellovibrio exovorus JSS]